MVKQIEFKGWTYDYERAPEVLRQLFPKWETCVKEFVDNSINAGGRVIEVHLLEQGGYRSIVVTDNGAGVSENRLKYLTQIFSKANENFNADNNSKNGSGLKIAITRLSKDPMNPNFQIYSKNANGEPIYIDSTGKFGVHEMPFKPEGHGMALCVRNIDDAIEPFDTHAPLLVHELQMRFWQFVKKAAKSVQISVIPPKAGELHVSSSGPIFLDRIGEKYGTGYIRFARHNEQDVYRKKITLYSHNKQVQALLTMVNVPPSASKKDRKDFQGGVYFTYKGRTVCHKLRLEGNLRRRPLDFSQLYMRQLHVMVELPDEADFIVKMISKDDIDLTDTLASSLTNALSDILMSSREDYTEGLNVNRNKRKDIAVLALETHAAGMDRWASKEVTKEFAVARSKIAITQEQALDIKRVWRKLSNPNPDGTRKLPSVFSEAGGPLWKKIGKEYFFNIQHPWYRELVRVLPLLKWEHGDQIKKLFFSMVESIDQTWMNKKESFFKNLEKTIKGKA